MTRVLESLPLTTFEEFLLWEDRPAYPWNVILRMHLTGRAHREPLELAFREALQRHPLLAATIDLPSRGRPTWRVVADPQPLVQWTSGDTGGRFPAMGYLDLRQEVGVRLFVVEGAAEVAITLQAHHACADGVGLFAFLHEMLVTYARRCGNTDVPLPEISRERLQGRGTYGMTTGKFVRMLPQQAVGLQGAWHFLQRKPVPLVPHKPQPHEDPPPSGFPCAYCRQFARDESQQLLAVAKRQGVTLNDLLMRDLFIALHQFREQNGIVDEDWLRMLVPMNLREAADSQLPAANMVSSVFIDRRRSDIRDRRALLLSLHEQMALIKNNQLGLTFIFSLHIGRWLPGGLKRLTRQDKCVSSCILTNVGRQFDESPLPRQDDYLVVGDAVLKSVDMLAPLRPYNCASISASMYAGCLNLCLHYDPRVLTDSQAESLIEQFVLQLNSSAEGE